MFLRNMTKTYSIDLEKLKWVKMKSIKDIKNNIDTHIENNNTLRNLRGSLVRLIDMDVSQTAAASCYYFIFSLFPLLLFLNTLLHFIQPNLSEQIQEMLPNLDLVVPGPVVSLLKEFVAASDTGRSISLLSISVIGLLWAGTKGVGNIVNGLSKTYHEKRSYNFLLQRFLGLIGILGLTLLLIAIIIVLAFNRFIINYLEKFLDIPEFIRNDQFNIMAYGFAFLALLIIFTIIYHALARGRAYVHQSLVAGAFASIGWLAISYFLQLFLDISSNFSARYGSISGIIFLMLWIYSAIYLIILGAFLHSELMRSKPKK